MNNLKKNLLPIYVFAKIDIRRLFRDKVAIFFIFVFPLIFLFVFGGIFNRDSGVSVSVGLINQSDSSFSREFVKQTGKSKILKVDSEVKTLDQARQKMNRGQIDATIILPKDFGTVKNTQYPSGQAKVLYDQDDEQAAQTVGSILDATFKDVNARFVKSETPFTVTTESTAQKGLRQFDYVFSGLLGFTILSLGVFGPTNVFPKLKTRGVLRRYHTTTLKVWQYFVGNIVSNALYGILSVAAMFVVALTIFDLNMKGNYLSLAFVVALGTAVIFGIGLAVGGWAKNENQAAPLAQIIAFPMMFLSGTFFPRFLMPEWLQTASGFLPLTPIIDAVRLIVTEGRDLLDLGPQIGLIALWGIIIYALAFRVFRWE